MTKHDKLISQFKECSGTFSWRNFKKIINQLGYEEVKMPGKTGGSRKRFFLPTTNDIIMVHQPHDGEMKPEMVKRLKQQLIEQGQI